MSNYPHLFDDINFLTRTTELYTQRREITSIPNNYKFTIEFLAAYLIDEFSLVTSDKLYYLHAQGSPNVIWNINHNLNRPVQVRCKDPDDNNMIGEVFDDTMNDTSIEFTVAVSGTALCT